MDQVVIVAELLDYYLYVMELVEIMQSCLPREVVDLFEKVKIDDKPSEWRLDIYLDERKIAPTHLEDAAVIAYAFADVTIQDFPIRGKHVYLHLRRALVKYSVANRVLFHRRSPLIV